MMTLNNTDGYTQKELDELNQEFEARFNKGEWNEITANEGNPLSVAEQIFSNIVANR